MDGAGAEVRKADACATHTWKHRLLQAGRQGAASGGRCPPAVLPQGARDDGVVWQGPAQHVCVRGSTSVGQRVVAQA